MRFNAQSVSLETYFDEKCFFLDNRVIHDGISLYSCALNLTYHYSDEPYEKRDSQTRDLWEKAGFENIYFCPSVTEKPTVDSIGFGFASKNIGDVNQRVTLISVAIRGGNYEAEWVNNGKVGSEGNANGFDERSDDVLASLKEYIEYYTIYGDVKLWFTGFSRSAAVANLAAGKIIDYAIKNEAFADMISYTERDVFAYCFETPAGVLDADEAFVRNECYKGIHNFINYNDLVPLVAPVYWGMRRYGQEHYFSDRLTDIHFDESEREKLVRQYHFQRQAAGTGDYNIDRWKFFDPGEALANQYNLPRQTLHPSLGRVVRDFMYELTHVKTDDVALTRLLYHYMIQDGLCELLSVAFGIHPNIQGIKVGEIISSFFGTKLVNILLNDLEEGRAYDFVSDTHAVVAMMLKTNDGKIDDVHDLCIKNDTFFYMFATAFNQRKDLARQFFFRDNMMTLIEPHKLPLCYAFLTASSHYYKGDEACAFNDGTYYTLKVKSADSFKIYEDSLKKDVFSFHDGVIESDCLCCELYADGTLEIHLPKNGNYYYEGNYANAELYEVDPAVGDSLLKENIVGDGFID